MVSIEPDLQAQRRVRDALSGDYRIVEFASVGAAMAGLSEPGAVPALGDAVAVVVSEHPGVPDLLGTIAWLRERQELEHAAILVTHPPGTSPALDALTAAGSVFYFLHRPIRFSELQQAVRRATDAFLLARENERLRDQLDRLNERLARENRFLKERVAQVTGLEGLIGNSKALRQALAGVDRVGGADTPVHLQGETGTGKELVARALHHGSSRAPKPFVAVNCGGMAESLLQSTLFGHRRGSFTGADRDHAGVFAQAHGGTLFLDEVAELSLGLQAALLRVLQEGEITPVGGTSPVKVDVRILSATHADLRERVRGGRFREDLYFRLVVVPVKLPPLREREGDVPLLARHFLQSHRRRLGRTGQDLTAEAIAALERYRWPGNIRELEHEMERLVVLADEETELGVELLSAHVRGASTPLAPATLAESDDGLLIPEGLGFDEAVELLMRQLLEEALTQAGSLAAAAERLSMDRSRLGKLRLRLGVGGKT